MMPGATPRELDGSSVLAAQSGDRVAIVALVRCYKDRVYRAAFRITGGSNAEDVTQETFVRVMRSLPGFDPRGAARLSTWILGIAARAAIDHLRRQRTRATHLAALPDPPSPRSPEAEVARAEIGARLAAAVETLGPEIRATFVLRAYHELTMPEIADALDVELGTVKSRLSRARETLRGHLGDLWDAYTEGGPHVVGCR